ncbi:hypothetical protein O181_133846, partial [Austropuccinia psidii MF-1]|nr:hypothetical protein [Austropuccinia psidii MF-1]
AHTDRAYSDSFRLTRSRPNKLSSGFTPFRHQQINDQESLLFTIKGGFQEKKRIQGEKQDLFQRKAERFRPHDTEVVVFGERNAQEPEVVQFSKLEASHERIKKLTASIDKIVKTLQEGHSQLSKASEETNKRLNLVFEEQHHRKKDRECLDQDIKKLCNVYHNLKPQPQGQVMENPYQQDAMLMNKARAPSQYQDGDGMSYSEKEALKQLPEASSWPKFSGTGEYDHMDFIDYIN